MNAHKASLINAVILIAMSVWGYLDSDTPSKTALIPAAFGLVLLLLNRGIKLDNKIIAHIAVVLTLLVLLALIKPFIGTIERDNTMGIIRVGLMILSCAWAMRYFIQSFIDARKAKEAGE